MRFQAFVLVPPDTLDIVATVTDLMAPYDVNRAVPARKEWVPKDEIQDVVEAFGLLPTDLEAVMAEVHADSGFECGVEDGKLYWLTTDNPAGHWDGWILHSAQEDVWPVTAIPETRIPFAIVTPDGNWHDLGYVWDPKDRAEEVLRSRAQAILQYFPTFLTVAVDCHV